MSIASPLSPSFLSHINVCIFAKAPIFGEVKTRLTTRYSHKVATDFHEWCVREVWRRHQSHSPLLYVTAPHPLWDELSPHRTVYQQAHGDLGHRMSQALSEQLSYVGRAHNTDPHNTQAGGALIIGTDSPSLPTKYIQKAKSILLQETQEEPRCVLGPACDGGYYLIGVNRSAHSKLSHIFHQIQWSTEYVLIETIQRIKEADLSLRLLPFWYDVDQPQDLDLLCTHLQMLPDQERPHLKELFKILNLKESLSQ